MLGFGKLAAKIFGSSNEKAIKAVSSIVTKINGYEDQIKKLSDQNLADKTAEFKNRIKNGETLDQLLPEAFAVVREASIRTIGQRPFDVQLIGGIFLHKGNIAEMKTGEGKTLTAVMPVYLNALLERGVHIVTVNDYLAKRDASWMGEIYNFLELRAKLEKFNNLEWRSNSDTEVILNLYKYYVDSNLSLNKFFSSLNGIFSIAIWDGSKQELIISRDSFGVKPLYFYKQENAFFFASEIKALLPFMNKFKEKLTLKDKFEDLDVKAIERYLTYLWCPGNRTPSKEIKKIEPGSFLRIKNGEIKEEYKWKKLPSLNFAYKKDKYLSKKDSIGGLKKYLKEAVRRQMISDVPLGAFLSGGIDSSSIVAFAKEFNPNIKCFTIDNGKESREGDLFYANQVAKHLDVDLSIVKIDPYKFISSLEHMVWQLDEPIADPASLNIKFICEYAKSQGIKVLLSGTGGDDIFSGYRRHVALRNSHIMDWIPLKTLKFMNNSHEIDRNEYLSLFLLNSISTFFSNESSFANLST